MLPSSLIRHYFYRKQELQDQAISEPAGENSVLPRRVWAFLFSRTQPRHSINPRPLSSLLPFFLRKWSGP